jgi:brefeldin A-inhibited guanine nucleotide-exchange protein
MPWTQGIQFLIETGFIASSAPQDIALFLLNTDGLSKSMIGEYLGDGCVIFLLRIFDTTQWPYRDNENIAIMHSFVNQLDFRELPFVDALRLFLQSFRLPGEAQKIDRFMLKFAERYMEGNIKSPFASAGKVITVVTQ